MTIFFILGDRSLLKQVMKAFFSIKKMNIQNAPILSSNISGLQKISYKVENQAINLGNYWKHTI